MCLKTCATSSNSIFCLACHAQTVRNIWFSNSSSFSLSRNLALVISFTHIDVYSTHLGNPWSAYGWLLPAIFFIYLKFFIYQKVSLVITYKIWNQNFIFHFLKTQLDTWNNGLKTTLRISGNNGFISEKNYMKILKESIVFDYKYLCWLYFEIYYTFKIQV